MVRLQKRKKQPAEGKKAFNLQVPMSVWSHWEKYCQEIDRTPTEAINLLIRMELEEAMEQGIIPSDPKIYVKNETAKHQENVDLIMEEIKKKPKQSRKKKADANKSVDTQP